MTADRQKILKRQLVVGGHFLARGFAGQRGFLATGQDAAITPRQRQASLISPHSPIERAGFCGIMRE